MIYQIYILYKGGKCINKLNIAIIFGGCGVESEVSVLSALDLFKAVDVKKYNCELVYISKNNHFYIGKLLSDKSNYPVEDKLSKLKEVFFQNVLDKLTMKEVKGHKRYQIDVVIPAVHGKNLEDGTITSIFDFLNVPTSSINPTSLGIIQNKYFTKMILNNFSSVKVLDFVRIDQEDFINNTSYFETTIKNLNFPVIIKPVSLGSSVGISIARGIDEVMVSLTEAFRYDQSVIIEKCLSDFCEYMCASVSDKLTSAIEKVVVKDKFYTYNDKYIDNSSLRSINDNISEKLKEEIKSTNHLISKIFNLDGLFRVDYLYDNDSNTLYVNEINGIPGSFSYYLFEKEGIYFPLLVDTLIKNAEKKYQINKSKKKFESNEIFKRKQIVK